MARQSTKSAATLKPSRAEKPYPGFPLTPHPSGRWCKKIRGKIHYFGKIDNPEAALEKFNQEWPFLKDGRTPPAVDIGNGCTIKLLVNAYLSSKAALRDAGELSERSFRDYHQTCELLFDHFGRNRLVDDLRPDDFKSLRSALAAGWSAVTLKNEINRLRGVFKFAIDERLIDRPVHFGQSFQRPSTMVLRKARNEAGVKLFTAGELSRILEAADPQLHAMTLLGLNCGFGNTDVANLPQSAIDLAGGWIDFPRPKTGIKRRCPLWPETVKALRTAIKARSAAKSAEDQGLVFLTRTGVRWVRVQAKRQDDAAEPEQDETKRVAIPIDALSPQFKKLLKSLKINGRRGLGFYTLRHNFETWAGESKDQVAVDSIMGHVDTSMAGQYRESISDARLRAVVSTVRKLAFPRAAK